MKLASCPSSCGDGSLRLMRLLRNKKFRASACKDSIERRAVSRTWNGNQFCC